MNPALVLVLIHMNPAHILGIHFNIILVIATLSGAHLEKLMRIRDSLPRRQQSATGQASTESLAWNSGAVGTSVGKAWGRATAVVASRSREGLACGGRLHSCVFSPHIGTIVLSRAPRVSDTCYVFLYTRPTHASGTHIPCNAFCEVCGRGSLLTCGTEASQPR
jgi:hypothetical protein